MEPLTIYDELIEIIETAEQEADAGHPVEAMIMLGLARARLNAYLDASAH